QPLQDPPKRAPSARESTTLTAASDGPKGALSGYREGLDRVDATPNGQRAPKSLRPCFAAAFCGVAAPAAAPSPVPESLSARVKMSFATWLSRWLITNGTPRFTARTSARPSETMVWGIFRARLVSTSEALMPPELSLRLATSWTLCSS